MKKNRTRWVILDDALLEQLEAYRSTHRTALGDCLTISRVLRAALRKFLSDADAQRALAAWDDDKAVPR